MQLGAILALSVPQGALDGEAASTMLRPGFGSVWSYLDVSMVTCP